MIICAAVEIQIENLPYITVIPCWRHGKGYEIIRDFGFKPNKKYKVVAEGFITNTGEFLDRKDAFKHALCCGQLSATTRQLKKDKVEYELYSEDLY